MAAPELSARNIVNPVSALHGEGNVAQLFHEREIAPMVAYFWQINDFASVCNCISCAQPCGCLDCLSLLFRVVLFSDSRIIESFGNRLLLIVDVASIDQNGMFHHFSHDGP